MWQLIRYGLVGLTTNAIIYCVYLIITCLGAEPKAAMTLMYIIGVSIGFIGNRKWTFSHEGNATYVALRYLLAHSFGYMLNLLILHAFVDHLGYAHQWIQVAAILIVAGFLFILFKYLVFCEKT
jgi:putative flippase GtrA